MKSRSKKIAIITLLACAFVIADYFGLFGGLCKDGAYNVKFTFKIYDQKTGKRLTDVEMKPISSSKRGIMCYHSNQDTHKGIIKGYISVGWGWAGTIFFDKYNFFKKNGDYEIDFEFYHPFYETTTQAILIKDLTSVHKVKMKPKSTENDSWQKMQQQDQQGQQVYHLRSQFKKIKNGMTPDEVLNIMGVEPQYLSTKYWRYELNLTSNTTTVKNQVNHVLLVHFKDGIVSNKETEYSRMDVIPQKH